MDIHTIRENIKTYILADNSIHMPSSYLNCDCVYLFTRDIHGVTVQEIISIDGLKEQLIFTFLPGIRIMTEYYHLVTEYIEELRKDILDTSIHLEKDGGIILRKIVNIPRDSITVAEIQQSDKAVIHILKDHIISIDKIAHGHLPFNIYSMEKKASISEEKKQLQDGEKRLLNKIDEFLSNHELMDELYPLSDLDSLLDLVNTSDYTKYEEKEFEEASIYSEIAEEQVESYANFMEVLNESVKEGKDGEDESI